MSAQFPGADFCLPGLTQGSSQEHRLNIAIAGAYSHVFNQRLLEHPFYGVWYIVLAAMISDLGPNVYVVPQFALDGLVPPLSDDEAMVASITNDHVKPRIPDFVIIHDITVYRPPHSDPSIQRWRRIKVELRQILLLVEGKRPPTRRPASEEVFAKALAAHLSEAKSDLAAQATKAFEGHANIQRLILIAFSGTWWIWTTCTREGYKQVVDHLAQAEVNLSASITTESVPDSDYIPPEETAKENERPKEKRGGKPAVGQSNTPRSRSSQPVNSAPSITGAVSSNQPVRQEHAVHDNKEPNNDSSRRGRRSDKVPTRDKGKRRVANSEGPTVTASPTGQSPSGPSPISSHSRSAVLVSDRLTAGPSRQPTTSTLCDGIVPSGPGQLRRSTRIRKPTERYKAPSPNSLRKPAPKEPREKFSTRFFDSIEDEEKLHMKVEDAVTARTNKFSLPILLGSAVSNQALYIIRHLLRQEINELNIPSEWADTGESPLSIDRSLPPSDDEIDQDEVGVDAGEGSQRETEDADEGETVPEESEEEGSVGSGGSERSWHVLPHASV